MLPRIVKDCVENWAGTTNGLRLLPVLRRTRTARDLQGSSAALGDCRMSLGENLFGRLGLGQDQIDAGPQRMHGKRMAGVHG
jgi:hypothetical protein